MFPGHKCTLNATCWFFQTFCSYSSVHLQHLAGPQPLPTLQFHVAYDCMLSDALGTAGCVAVRPERKRVLQVETFEDYTTANVCMLG